ncbi:MAG: septal ring lytic transglycosylase RlpA family protein [Treponema sp.]|nr:septal ring lytic transglycosylase RlpA family protein [Treponema sp.]
MKRIVAALTAGFFAIALCGAQNSTDLSNFRQEGIASWYGTEFDGRPTASGETFNSSLYTAAHPTLPFGTLLTVTNMNNGRKVNVRVNDRGPFVSSRIIDLSQAAAYLLDMVSTGTAPVVVELAQNTPTYSQGTGGTYQADTTSNAISQGGYTSATSQIYAPYPSYQTPQAPVYQNPPVQSGEPVVVQVQPPQQQITQYFQQPQTQVPRQQQPAQAAQQVLPVQQVIQPVQPIVQPITPQEPSQPVVQSTQAPAQTTQPVQINIPIEVRPVVSSEPIVIPAPRTEAPAADPSPAVPASVTPLPAAPVPTVPAPATSVPGPAVSAPAPVPVPPVTVKPNTIYRIQVGSFREVRNALAAAERLKNAGLNPAYERNGEFFRVVLSEIPSEEVNGVLQKIGNAGFENPLLREER